MKMRGKLFAAVGLWGLLLGPVDSARAEKPVRVSVRAGIDHQSWNLLVGKYVDAAGLVDYAAWKASAADREALREYVGALAAPAEPAASGDERSASLINAYNALTISWVLDHYPIASIRATSRPFDGRRHVVGGRKASLDDIEHGTLRPDVGFRVHAAVSCASRSCPPLSAQAWETGSLSQRLDAAMRGWLDREDLNRFDPARNEAELSAVFRWYREDFEKAGGLEKVLAEFGPERDRAMLARGGYDVSYLRYDWGLNDQGKEGRDYGGLRSILDRL
jgi:Protein of unknown function, DUF547